MKNNLLFKLLSLFFVFGLVFSIAYGDLSVTEENLINIPTIETTNEGFITRVAPGEFFPISVKILNFGGTNRVDATITYQIFNSYGEEVYVSTETVAIETTASFVKIAQIPFDSPPGIYTAKAYIIHENQIEEAITQFPFKVEKKLFGLFKSDFYRYALFFIPICIFMILLGNIIVKRRNKTRFSPHNYSQISEDKRIFFELVSDTIMEMKQRVGDRALEIAQNIDGLKIDIQTGRVLEISERPSKIIALLVSRYEEILGKKVSFSFRR